jgi:hypothetical protein
VSKRVTANTCSQTAPLPSTPRRRLPVCPGLICRNGCALRPRMIRFRRAPIGTPRSFSPIPWFRPRTGGPHSGAGADVDLPIATQPFGCCRYGRRRRVLFLRRDRRMSCRAFKLALDVGDLDAIMTIPFQCSQVHKWNRTRDSVLSRALLECLASEPPCRCSQIHK